MSSTRQARSTSPNYQRVGSYQWDLDNPQGYANRIGRYRTDVESRFLFDHIGPDPQRILDMGGGSGRFGGELAFRGHDVTLIDMNPHAIALAQQRGIQRTRVCDICDFDEAGFDGVVCMEVVEYFEKCDTVFSKAAQSLKTGGTFVFCVTNSQSWRFRLRKLKANTGNVHAFSIDEIERSLAAHSFKTVERKGFQWSLAQTGSDSRILNATAWLERGLGLQNWLSQSPWLLYACLKSS